MFKQLRTERGERGFTLVELLVVIAILGVLAGVAVFALTSVGDNGQANACAVERTSTLTAIAAYSAQNAGAAPTDAQIAPFLTGTRHYNIPAGGGALVATAPCS